MAIATVELGSYHYTEHHNSGLPIRLPGYLRADLKAHDPFGAIQVAMIERNPFVGNRSPEDTVRHNFQENARLRRIARQASRILVAQAEEWGVRRYCTIVHGSLARGLVRQPTDSDPSDVDIDLILDEPLPKKERQNVRDNMRQQSKSLGARIDSYVLDLNDMYQNHGFYPRIYLGSSAYPIIDNGNLWNEIRRVGLENQRLQNFPPATRRRLKHAINLLSSGREDEAFNYADSLKGCNDVRYYLSEFYSVFPKRLLLSLKD